MGFCSPVAHGTSIVLLFMASGCGGDVSRAAVEGTVTFQGQPVADGSIVFQPIGDTKGVPAGADIVDGRYHLPAAEGAAVGLNRVEILAFRATGRKVPDQLGDVSNPNRSLVDEKINFLPAEFNVQSRLTTDVEPTANQADFAL